MIVESSQSVWILGYACYCFYLQSKEVMINKRKRNKWKLTLATNSKSIGNHWSSISSFKNKFAFTWFYHRYVNILIVYNKWNERKVYLQLIQCYDMFDRGILLFEVQMKYNFLLQNWILHQIWKDNSMSLNDILWKELMLQ